MRYQRLRIPSATSDGVRTEQFAFNVPEYFDHLFSTDTIPLVREGQRLTTQPIDYKGEKGRFVRETILWGAAKRASLIVNALELPRMDLSSAIVEAQRAERAKVILANCCRLRLVSPVAATRQPRHQV